MRTREHIENDAYWGRDNDADYVIANRTELLLETMLDIRDLLEKLSTPPPSKSNDAPVE